MTAAPNNKPNVLLLVDRRQSRTARMLKTSGYNISTTYTPDHAVAICVNNRIDAVVLDQQHFIETEGWSVAKSLKMIRGTVRVILVVRGRILSQSFPAGVDAIVPEHDDEALVQALERLLARPGNVAAD